ncbi:unnamed protein product (macronuclear) [Paramecium tetraurelia]|uniref:Centrosomal protein of 19 kDa n=2 Tax=Paramecium TaxID=5884 RepID=A0BRR2_PARTE|nr:uncharacterized protein GSPATT00031460001 [Paramecium tetraurelia]CAK61229.1 unnamed protein product [Paramecium tetraurelia]|eukprot:XP_001428627.1 hypothetical protein (macronuclear) [Paramecium tetraurelia strain d4-2]
MYNFAKTAAKDPYNFDINQKATTGGTKKNDTGDKSKKLSNMEPKRLAIRFDPPMIIVEYLQPSSGKLYHHKMKLLKLKPDTPINHALEYLKKKHAMYFMNNKIPEKQLLGKQMSHQQIELIGKIQKRLQISKPNVNANATLQRPTSSTRPLSSSTQASMNMSKTQSKLQKDIEDYGMSEEDLYNYAMKNQKGKQPVLEDDDEDEDEECYDQNYEEEDSEDEITDEQYKMLYQKMGYNQLNLNKMTTEELKKHKEIMESMYKKNSVKPGDKNYKYDVQKNFKPSAQNQWDMDDEEDYDIV